MTNGIDDALVQRIHRDLRDDYDEFFERAIRSPSGEGCLLRSGRHDMGRATHL